MDSIRISLATVEDIEHIASVQRLVWPDEKMNIVHIQSALTHPSHAVVIVRCNQQLVGFADGFVTISGAGLRRWEVDLLAVHPDYQGRGLGTRLVAASLEGAVQKDTQVARGLVRLDNLASQLVFARCRFLKVPQELTLYVSTGNSGLSACETQEGRLIEVQTFSYRGLWLEESLTESALASAGYICGSRNLDLAGALIPSADERAIRVAQRLGFSPVGMYQWWAKNLV